MSYTKFLQEKFKIAGKLQQAIVYAIALVDDKGNSHLILNFMYLFY
jgi:hypothetical protein